MAVRLGNEFRFVSRSLASAVLLFGAEPAAAGPCKPARLDRAVAESPGPWQSALVELVAASTEAGQPWGCPDSQLSLALPEAQSYALLSVESASGRRMERLVSTPADLVPIGKALLARVEPLTESAADRSQSYTPPPSVTPGPERLAPDAPDLGPAPAETGEPRAYFDAQGSARYAGATDGLMAGGSLRATLPLHPWMVGLWGRYEALAHSFTEPGAQELFVGSLAVGLVGGYRMVDEPVRLDVGVTGSLALINMSGEQPDISGDGEGEVEAGSADGRLGAEFRLGVPFSRSWHGLATVDAEIAPAALAGEDSRVLDELLPPLPAYTVGLSLGVEGALR
jgi:hypothetical protein